MKHTILLGVLTLVIIFSLAAFAVADSVTYTGTPNASGDLEASGTVQVKASVNPKITLTVDTPDATQTVDFGSVDPGTYGGKTVALTVDSNMAFDLSAAENTGAFGGIALTRSLADQSGVAKGEAIGFTDAYSIDVPWTTDPGAYSATVQYTVTQQ